MIEVQFTVEVEREQVEVFDYLADVTNNPAWQAGVFGCLETSQPPMGQGSTFRHRRMFGDAEAGSSFEVIEFEPDYRFRTRTITGSLPREVIHEVSRRSDGATQVRSTVRVEPGGWFMVFAFAVRWGFRFIVRGDGRRLKREIERGQSADP